MKLSAFLILLILLAPLTTHSSTKTYYVDRTNGLDSNTGLSPNTPWKTISKVNSHNFLPGDRILFSRDQLWREMLIPSSSGKSDQPIYIGAYGQGNNPKILRTSSYSSWTLISPTNSAKKIWEGKIPGVKNSWGIVINNQRLPSHKQYDKISVTSLKNGHFFSPLNKSMFYLRNDAGHPGLAEIGAREAAIMVEDKHHIVIENIDTFGPGGRSTSGSSTGFMNVMIIGKSSHVTLKNMTISHGNSIGISSKFDTHRISYINLTSHDNAGTGIYMNGHDGLIQGCTSFNNGKLKTDSGDRGGIGSFRGKNIRVIGNETYSNGPADGYADFEISMVGTGKTEILQNYLHDCLQGCIQIAEGGDNSIISNNIIDRYGSATGKMPSPGQLSGIRIGGGKQGSRNIEIKENIIANGFRGSKIFEAGIYVSWHDNSGLDIKDNIFHKNSNQTFVLRHNKSTKEVSFSGNVISNQPIKVMWRNKNFTKLSQLHFLTRNNKENLTGDANFASLVDEFLASNVLDRDMPKTTDLFR